MITLWKTIVPFMPFMMCAVAVNGDKKYKPNLIRLFELILFIAVVVGGMKMTLAEVKLEMGFMNTNIERMELKMDKGFDQIGGRVNRIESIFMQPIGR